MSPRNTNNSKKGTCAAEVHNMNVGASNSTGTVANRNSNEGHVDRSLTLWLFMLKEVKPHLT